MLCCIDSLFLAFGFLTLLVFFESLDDSISHRYLHTLCCKLIDRGIAEETQGFDLLSDSICRVWCFFLSKHLLLGLRPVRGTKVELLTKLFVLATHILIRVRLVVLIVPVDIRVFDVANQLVVGLDQIWIEVCLSSRLLLFGCSLGLWGFLFLLGDLLDGRVFSTVLLIIVACDD